jgi:hypothetical protein
MTATKNADAGDWDAVCTDCGRVHRNGEWTNEIAHDAKGTTKVLCTPCYERELDSLREKGVLE